MKRQFETSLWGEPGFEDLNRDGKLVYLFIYYNDRTPPSGVLPISPKRISRELDISKDEATKEIANLVGLDLIGYDHELQYAWIKRFTKEQTHSHTFLHGALKDLEKLPDELSELRASWCEHNAALLEKRGVSAPKQWLNATPVTTKGKVKKKGKKKTVDAVHNQIVEHWNFHAEARGTPSINGVDALSQRERVINARVTKHGLEGVMSTIDKAFESDFLCGENDINWTMTFDWLMKSANYTKVLEGNYRGNGKKKNVPSGITDGEPGKPGGPWYPDLNFDWPYQWHPDDDDFKDQALYPEWQAEMERTIPPGERWDRFEAWLKERDEG